MASSGLLAGQPILDSQACFKVGNGGFLNGVGVMSPSKARKEQVGQGLCCLCSWELIACTTAEHILNPVQVYKWDFNVFDYSRECGDRPLTNLTLQMLEDQQLLVSIWPAVHTLTE